MVTNNHIWTVTVQEEDGELVLPFPPDLLSQMGWVEGTELFWEDNENGIFSIKEKENGTGEGK